MTEDIIIPLPSLIRRIGGEVAKQAKEMAKQNDCLLKRVRRSRNWTITGKAMNIAAFSARMKSQDSDLFRHLIQKIDTALLDHKDKLEPLEAKLIRLITDNPSITLAELIHLTDCTMAEARTARFDADNW